MFSSVIRSASLAAVTTLGTTLLTGVADAGTTQDADVLVIVERFDDGRFEAFIQVDTTPGLLTEVRLASPGEPAVTLDQFDNSFELELKPDGTFEEFLTFDATGETFDLQLFQSGGAVTVYRFAVSDVFGPQIDVSALPGTPSALALNNGDPATLTWSAPANRGEFLILFGERPFDAGEDLLFAAASPLPFSPPLLLAPPFPVPLLATELELPPGATDGPIEASVSYGQLLGSFSPVLVSGPALDLGNTVGAALSSAEARFDPPNCIADLAPPAGVLDIDDVLTFLTAFAQGNAAADLAPSFGVLNIDDVLTFLAAFSAGCP